MRILILDNIINPHMTPVFEAISRTRGIELGVAFFAEREVDRTWNAGSQATFRSTVLPGRHLSLPRRWNTLSFHLNSGLGRLLSESAPDVLINAGWVSPTNWHAFLLCRRRGIKHVLWSGSTRSERSWRRTVSRPLVKRLVRQSDGWASYGSAASDYLCDLGADPARVVPAYHAIDNTRFLDLCVRARPRVEAERAALGLENRKVVLFVGRMVECKGVGYLIDALIDLQRERDDVTVVAIGEGPMRDRWERQARAVLPAAAVRFLGSRSLDELPLFYQLADLFVLPSVEEVWGLVVNEASLAGLPVVVSEACGAAADLVEPGVNGYRVPPRDASALARAIRQVLSDPANPRRMGQQSRRIVERCTPAKLASALLRAAELALSRSPV